MNIPSSWQILPLQKVAKLQTGLTLNSKLKILCPVCVPYLRVANVQAGHIELGDLKTVVIESSTMQRFVLHPGDVLLTEGGDFDKLGRGAVWRGQISPCLHQNHVFAIRTDRLKLLPEFLSYQTESNYGRNYFLSCSKQSTNLASINSTQIKNFPVIVPPLNEQRRIAEFLGTWDEAIEKLERLIAAKEKQQKVLFNHIFDQVKKQEFQQCKLVNICTIHKGVQLGKFEMNAEGRYPVLNGGISYSGYTDSYNCEANTIAISEGGNSCGFVNLIREKFWCGGHCYALKNILISMQYLFFFLKHRQDMLMNLRVGSGLPNIQKKDLENVEVVFPIMEGEQNRFSEILLCAQNELELLRKKLAALQKQKRGLMQKLLTGTWRV